MTIDCSASRQVKERTLGESANMVERRVLGGFLAARTLLGKCSAQIQGTRFSGKGAQTTVQNGLEKGQPLIWEWPGFLRELFVANFRSCLTLGLTFVDPCLEGRKKTPWTLPKKDSKCETGPRGITRAPIGAPASPGRLPGPSRARLGPLSDPLPESWESRPRSMRRAFAKHLPSMCVCVGSGESVQKHEFDRVRRLFRGGIVGRFGKLQDSVKP